MIKYMKKITYTFNLSLHLHLSLSFNQFATNEAIQRTEAYEYAQSLGSQSCSLPNFQVIFLSTLFLNVKKIKSSLNVLIITAKKSMGTIILVVLYQL